MTVLNAIASRARRCPHLLLLLLLPALSPARDTNRPAELSENRLSRRELIRLVDQYVAAIEDRNFAAWRELLSPLHAGSPLLTPDAFIEKTDPVTSISVKQIDGLTAALKIEYRDDREETGYLQLSPAGHIKYTPFVFRHPVAQACALVKTLLYDRITILGETSSALGRAEAARELAKLGIPLCGYDPLAPSSLDRQAAAWEIFYWLEENGSAFDNSEPRIPVVGGEFLRCLNEARSVVP